MTGSNLSIFIPDAGVLPRATTAFILPDILKLKPPGGDVSEIAKRARQDILDCAEAKGKAEAARKKINARNASSLIAKVSTRLNGLPFDDVSRLLLAEPNIYGAILDGIFPNELNVKPKADPEDTIGFADAVARELHSEKGFRYKFLVQALLHWVEREHVDVKKEQLEDLAASVVKENQSIPVAAGQFEKELALRIGSVLQAGDIPRLINVFADNKEIQKERMTPAVKARMAQYLRSRGIVLTEKGVQDGKFDEYFALAYDRAISSSEGGADPVIGAATGQPGLEWDFTVDTFETTEEQGVVRENILAAGALDYIYELGERIGIFRLVDAIITNWASGAIDVATAQQKLYSYYKLRDQRATVEERGMHYKRVLNKGDANVLERVVVNEDFTPLWDKLMAEAVEFIRRREKAIGDSMDVSTVSRVPIFEATRQLQYNLSEFCTGMAHIHARESYAALQAGTDILKDPEIGQHFAGGRRGGSIWTTIERLSKSEFGEAPDIAGIRTLAVEGNKIFRWIADFTPGAVPEDRFREFLDAAEAYVLAKASDQGGEPEFGEEEAEEETAAEDEFNEMERQ